MRKRTALFLAALLVLAAPLPAVSKSLETAWERGGFAQPESVLWDAERRVLYVSNVNGNPPEKDGNGYISRLSPEGRVLDEKWVVDLDAPKGMAVVGERLYVADIDRLVVIDIPSGKIIKTYLAEGAKFLNDVAAGPGGYVYVSDMLDDAVWRLAEGEFTKWLADPALEGPNGLIAEPNRLVVAAWGKMTGKGFDTSKPGAVKAVGWVKREIRDLGPGLGNLDGIEPLGEGAYLVSDWVEGSLFRVDAKGGRKRLAKPGPGSADIGFIPESRLILVPMMQDGKVRAYRLP